MTKPCLGRDWIEVGCVWLPMEACVVDDTIVINSSGGCFYLRLLEGISGIYVGGVIISNIE